MFIIVVDHDINPACQPVLNANDISHPECDSNPSTSKLGLIIL